MTTATPGTTTKRAVAMSDQLTNAKKEPAVPPLGMHGGLCVYVWLAWT